MCMQEEKKSIANDLYIRTDANSILGIGHVMRCLPVAEEWCKQGGTCIFLVADGESASVVESLGYTAISLEGKWDRLEEELPELISLIQERNIRRILIDSYYVSEGYMAELARHCKTIYLGKKNEQAKPVDMIIDYTINAEEADYSLYHGEHTKMLLGGKYFPLRAEFKKIAAQPAAQVEKILLTTGGTDPYHVAKLMTQCLLEDTTLEIHVIVGRYNGDKDELRKREAVSERLHVHENVSHMAALMEKCDIAISAGGITLYELCAAGVPTITYVLADNQREAVRTFAQKNIMMTAGDIRKNEARVWKDKMLSCVKQLCTDDVLREGMRKKMQAVVDGSGAVRIAREIAAAT